MHRIRVGCSGWNYDSWRGGIYPEGLAQRRWLERYAELFDTVEVNSTFYRLASRAGVERWVEQTPQDFVFAVKASQYLTHMKRLRDMETGVERFYDRIQPLVDAGRLGPVVWQLPGNFHRDDERLAGALEPHLELVDRTAARWPLSLPAADALAAAAMGPSAHHLDPADLAGRVARGPDLLPATASVVVSRYRPRPERAVAGGQRGRPARRIP